MKHLKRFCIILCALIFCFGFVGCKKTASNNDDIKNVIILIGDGMGKNHVTNSQRYFDKEYPFTKDYATSVHTRSLDSSITDSAAAATALATGVKVNNGEVGYHDGQAITNIMEIAKQKGKKTGIITTDELCGATPACYSAHANNRSNSSKIVADQVQSGIDLFVGQNLSGVYELENGGGQFTDAGYTLIDDATDFTNLDKAKKYLGNFENMRSKYNEELTAQADIEEIIKNALEFLDGEKGFCLMIENAFIDKCSHSNDFVGAMSEVYEFSDMIDEVYKFCEGRKDTAVLITADHETGGLSATTNRAKMNNSLFSTGGHTGADVNLYLKYVAFDKKKVIDNTQIFLLCKSLVENDKYLVA